MALVARRFILAGESRNAGIASPGATFSPVFRQIDGGPTYYADNSFTYATNTTDHPSWDDPTFFPIGAWQSAIFNQTPGADRWNDLGWNTTFNIQSNTIFSLCRTNKISVLAYAYEIDLELATNTSYGNETVAINVVDDWAGNYTDISTPISGASFGGQTATWTNARQDHRLWWVNLGHNIFVSGSLTGSPGFPSPPAMIEAAITTPSSLQRKIDILTIDCYGFSAIRAVPPDGGLEINAMWSVYFDTNPTPPFHASGGYGVLTLDQGSRGSFYGDTVDVIRFFHTGSHSYPIFSIIETGGPFNEDYSHSSYPSPEEINWAVWASIVHGARAIIYFDACASGPGTGAGGGASNGNMAGTFFQSPPRTVTIGTASISGTTLTASGVAGGQNLGVCIQPGDVITGTGVVGTVRVLQQLTAPAATFNGYIDNGTPGVAGQVLHVSGISGTILQYGILTGAGVTAKTLINGQTGGTTGSNGTYTVHLSQLVGSAGSPVAMTSTAQYGIDGTYKISGGSGSGSSWVCSQTIAVYDQVKATTALVKSLAAVINAPFVTNFATVTPAGYTFPTPKYGTGSAAFVDGIDIMVKYSGGHYYIFACTRCSAQTTNILATFTVPPGFSSVDVVNESRSRPIAGGVFTDTFDFAWTVHIYKVNP